MLVTCTLFSSEKHLPYKNEKKIVVKIWIDAEIYGSISSFYKEKIEAYWDMTLLLEPFSDLLTSFEFSIFYLHALLLQFLHNMCFRLNHHLWINNIHNQHFYLWILKWPINGRRRILLFSLSMSKVYCNKMINMIVYSLSIIID